jgi:hypothetical protein
MGFFSGTTFSQVLSGATSIFTQAGVTGTAQTTALQQLGSLLFTNTNPNQAAELALAGQIMTFAGNPTVEADLVNTLIREQGLPANAAAIAGNIAKKLGTTGYDPSAEALEIEQIIRAGG